MHARADMGSRKRADMDLESRAISARVTKQIVTIFSKACDNISYVIQFGKLFYPVVLYKIISFA